MNPFKISIIISLSLLISACEFKQSVSQDLTTGAYSNGDGLACDDIKIEIDGTQDNRNIFIFGERVNFIFNNVTGFTKEGDKVFPGLSLYIIENKKDTVVSNPNLFEDLKDGTDLSPLKLQANFGASLPHLDGEKYDLYINIWDEKGDGTFSYELPFSIEPSDLLNIESNGIDYSNIYLWNQSQERVVFDQKVNSADILILLLEGVEGLTEKEGKVYPMLSVDLIDAKGNPIISNPNILNAYETEGVDATTFTAGQIPITLTFTAGLFNNPHQLRAVLTDQQSTKKLTVETSLEFIK